MKIEDLNVNDRIIFYEKDKYGTVIDKSYANDWAKISIDGAEWPMYITNEDYFDKLPISFKRTMKKKEVNESDISTNDKTVPSHYQGTGDIDVIEFCRQHFTPEEFRGAMKFNLIKYPTRLGKKDDEVKELNKIIDYAQRLKEGL